MTDQVKLTAGTTGMSGKLLVNGQDISRLVREVEVLVSVNSLTRIDVTMFSDVIEVEVEGEVQYRHDCPNCQGHDTIG